MARQRSLDFDSARIAAISIWKQVPEGCRKQAVALWGQLIAAAAQRRSKGKGARS